MTMVHYWDDTPTGFAQIAANYATGAEFFTQVGRELVDLTELNWGDRVLDVGCGKGAVTIPAAIRVGLEGHVIGIDASREMLEQAAVQIRRFRLGNVSLYIADGQDPRSATNLRESGIQHPSLTLSSRPTWLCFCPIRPWRCGTGADSSRRMEK